MIHIGGRSYELVEDHKNGWNPEAFRDRYSDVLDRYDYVIGDWGYNQLRLKGFFRDNHPKATPGSAIAGMVDYINEYCNFGCAYFVLLKHPGGRREGGEDDIDLDELVPESRGEGDGESDEVAAYRSAAPVAAAEGEEREKREHVRAVPRNPRDQRREYQRPQYGRKDNERDSSHGGRKPYPKERDKDGRARQQGANPGGSGERAQQGQGQERSRSKKHAYAAKAPVAAASETQAAPPRGRDASGPKNTQ